MSVVAKVIGFQPGDKVRVTGYDDLIQASWVGQTGEVQKLDFNGFDLQYLVELRDTYGYALCWYSARCLELV